MERSDGVPGVRSGEETAGDPWVELVRSNQIMLFCVLCGKELGPRPVQAVVLVPEGPNPSVLGQACGDCLRSHSVTLADAIEEHVEWLTGVATDLSRIARLARSGQLRRPTLQEWQAANEVK